MADAKEIDVHEKHASGSPTVGYCYNTWKISRYAFFTITCCISFCWYWFPDFIFPALSYFNFPCWINPTSSVVNPLFGMKSGMGLIPITFDCMHFINMGVYDNTRGIYKVSKIVNKASGYTLDLQKYLACSPVYMPITYALNMFGLSFATLSTLLVWVTLEHRQSMLDAARRVPQMLMESLPGRSKPQGYHETGAPDVPIWWYLVGCALALFMSIFAVEYWDAELRWYGVLLACAVALVSTLEIVSGSVFEGKVLANIWFFDIGYITTIKGLYFAHDMKLAYYCKIPQRKLFLVQCVGTLSSLGVLNWALNHISGVCTSAAVNGFRCPFSSTPFNTSLIWGAVGPRRYFSNHIGYHALLYFFIIGAILPYSCLLPESPRVHGWWSKYNFVLSSALDPSVGIAGVFIFLTIYFTGASERFSWWGTDVYQNTCDWKGCPYLSVPKGVKFGA
ncbi:Glutathione transporter 1 [Penicillium subrubescens]|uniref:Glutathione transporter 1 n=1 Tax=Penicillium subrubescens TaxID=1316194 RepID=A0A1Q5TCC5_9EURO|nr:Glutathione transporter 1 [Penicillium subrubescens]